ncbi:hypothetical protein ACFLQL_00150 [Verrucomicrobiota bacterium]
MAGTKETMSPDKVNGLLKQATDYVGLVQPQLDSYNEQKETFIKKAHQIVGMLTGKGLIHKHKSNELIDKLAEDPTVAFEVINKLAAMITPASLGNSSEVKTASDNIKDPFERLILTGSVTGQESNKCMVD